MVARLELSQGRACADELTGHVQRVVASAVGRRTQVGGFLQVHRRTAKAVLLPAWRAGAGANGRLGVLQELVRRGQVAEAFFRAVGALHAVLVTVRRVHAALEGRVDRPGEWVFAQVCRVGLECRSALQVEGGCLLARRGQTAKGKRSLGRPLQLAAAQNPHDEVLL